MIKIFQNIDTFDKVRAHPLRKEFVEKLLIDDLIKNSNMHVFSYKKEYYLFDYNTLIILHIDRNIHNGIKIIKSNSEVSSKTRKCLDELKPFFIAGLLSYGQVNDQIVIENNLFETYNFYLSDNCNFICKYCARHMEYGNCTISNNVMQDFVIDKAIKMIFDNSKADIITIHFTGGEPLLYYNKINYCIRLSKEEAKKKEKRVRFSITTNGSIINNKIIEMITDNKDSISIMISFDGPSKIHNKNRLMLDGGDTFVLIKRFIRELKLHGFKRFYLRPTVCVEDFGKVYKILKYLSSFDAKGILIQPEMIGINDSFKRKSVMINKYNRQIKKYILTRKSIDDVPEKNKKIINIIKNFDYRDFGCAAGYKMITFSPEGNIFSCAWALTNPKYKIGDINNEKISINSASLNNKQEKCIKCIAKKICAGGCVLDNENDSYECSIDRELVKTSLIYMVLEKDKEN